MLSSPSNWLWRYNHLVQAKLHGPLWASLDVASLIRSALRNTVLMVGGLGQRWHHVSLQVVGRATSQKWCILSSRLEDSGSEHVKTTHTNHTKHVDKVFRGHFEEIPQSVHVMLSSPSNWLWRYNHLVQAKLHGPLWASLDVASLIRSALRKYCTYGRWTGTKMTSCFVASWWVGPHLKNDASVKQTGGFWVRTCQNYAHKSYKTCW